MFEYLWNEWKELENKVHEQSCIVQNEIPIPVSDEEVKDFLKESIEFIVKYKSLVKRTYNFLKEKDIPY